MRWPLGAHGGRWLDGHDLAVGGFVRSGAGTDIQDARCAAQGRVDQGRDGGLGLAVIAVSQADRAVVRVTGAAVRLPDGHERLLRREHQRLLHFGAHPDRGVV